MLEDILIPEAQLRAHDEFVKANARSAVPNLAVDLENETYGRAFRYFLLLSDWPSQLGNDPPPNQEALFYNEYYWFLRFVRLHALAHGPDAGLEQQAFQMIEQAGFDVDWTLLEEIEKKVSSELRTE